MTMTPWTMEKTRFIVAMQYFKDKQKNTLFLLDKQCKQ